MKTEFRTLTERTQSLLNRQEGHDVEFKITASAVESSDIVAFANSDSGGAILIGVSEIESDSHVQRGKVVGTKVGDDEKLKLLNKAESCVPPIDIDVLIENTAHQPIFRLEIPSGQGQPYCTQRGLYTIRGDGRTKALLPGRLLSMFMQRQGDEFIERFRSATLDLEKQLSELRNKTTQYLREVNSTVRDVAFSLERNLEGISDSVAGAQEMADQATAFSDEALGLTAEIFEKVEMIRNEQWRDGLKIEGLLDHFGIEDPWITQLRDNVKRYAKEILDRSPRIRNSTLIEDVGQVFRGAHPFQVEKWVKEARAEFRNRDK